MDEHRLRIQGLTRTDRASAPGGLVPYGREGLLVLPAYGVEVDDPRSPYLYEIEVVVIDGQARCDELRVLRRPAGPPVTSEALRRVPLATYLMLSASLFTYHAQLDENGDVVFMQSTGSGDEAALVRAARPQTKATDTHLREVARIYMESGKKPTLAVQRAYGVSRATAARWVRAARDKKFITDTNKKESTR